MKAKLTLTVEERLIERAMRHARAHGTSVSHLVEKYFAVMEGEPTVEPSNSDFTCSLRGVMAGSKVTEDDYHRYLEEKHPHLHVIPRYEGDAANPTGGVRNVIAGAGDYRGNAGT